MNTDTSKWETFKNTFYTFKYPADKYVIDIQGGDREGSLFLRKNTGRSGESEFILYIRVLGREADSWTIEEYMEAEYKPFLKRILQPDIKTEPIIVNKIKGLRVVNPEVSPKYGLQDELFFMHAGKVLNLNMNPGPEVEEILKTFELV